MTHYCHSCGRWALLDRVAFWCRACLAAWQAAKAEEQ